MYYVDEQKTLTRRSSSLVVERIQEKRESEAQPQPSARVESTPRLQSESISSISFQPRIDVRTEIINKMFEAMLPHIIESWEVIKPLEEPLGLVSEINIPTLPIATTEKPEKVEKMTKKRASKQKKSQVKSESIQMSPSEPSLSTIPSERVVIRFRNGNSYEGPVYMKRMHGNGRFQWADGTIYMGNFENNVITGLGKIQFKDETWYEGEWADNIRHGAGLFVDSRQQRSYSGAWSLGAKHGRGVIHYGRDNFYDGDWDNNTRSGFGTREYCLSSGYKGEWKNNVMEGKGLMIWPNHDFYRGDWKIGKMWGYGVYTWDAYKNMSMAHPTLSVYRGDWERGMRNGYGILDLGFSLGSQYKGEFKDNKKHGVGKFITNNGFIIQDRHLFNNDTMASFASEKESDYISYSKNERTPIVLNMCDGTVGLTYHINEALTNIAKDENIRADIINEYIENNMGDCKLEPSYVRRQTDIPLNLEDFVQFEVRSLQNALQCYQEELQRIYNQYATICNTEEIGFTPILIRLYLWQLFYDCDIHDKGLTLVTMDRMFHRNPKWMARSLHHPFEKVYYWQYLHNLVAVACKLYCDTKLPSAKPDTIVAAAFRKFMENDLIPSAGKCKGKLVNGYGRSIPLKPVYRLYRSLGEPHSVRAFLRAVRRPRHQAAWSPQPGLVDVPADAPLVEGTNAYRVGDELHFVPNKLYNDIDPEQFSTPSSMDLKLFNFGNLTTKSMINIFAEIFPQMLENGHIMCIDTDLTFLEFFEGFIACAEESIRVKDEELEWREKFSKSKAGSVKGK
ncbi:radial spoke head 10 homolog B isoform X2 [Plutella xylostella]|uniref:radial spoke head 10 homolog B isoform X2 n=1 Tax=Plutella xylostella TaxID=51655 RepID=UPI00203221ED|nr:radial spoke head 10 homolog B isoform X2 [Plutella xylostella]